MIALALESSSLRGSAALFSDDRLLVEESWNEKEVRPQYVFEALPRLLAKASVKIEEVDRFIAGRGPGAYSGLRVALTAAQALALPGGKPVFAVSSGEALALESAKREDAPVVAVTGDARRGTLWLGVFEVRDGEARTLKPWAAPAVSDLPALLPPGCVLVSPDATRLSPALAELRLSHVRWVPEDRCPTAEYVGRCGLERMRKGMPSEPLSPIYMHPAVGK